MALIRIKRGLNLPIVGQPEQTINNANQTSQVALLGTDYVGMKPTMVAAVGDRVKLGQVLFTDKKIPDVKYTAPGTGRVVAINRGDKRVFISLVIELDGTDHMTFQSYKIGQIGSLKRGAVIEQLINSGLWTSLRSRPFGHVADPQKEPHSIFVTAMDTHPLAPSMEVILKGQEEEFKAGLAILSKLTEGALYLCKSPKSAIPEADLPTLKVVEFAGPHPAGLPGTHIHFLDPVSRQKTVWHVAMQDVVAIARLFLTGQIHVERVISLAGPMVKQPRLLKTRLGARISDLTRDQLVAGELRNISGSVFSGHTAAGATDYLGRYHQQVTVIAEDRRRQFLGWLSPGFDLYSLKSIVGSKFVPGKKFRLTTSLNGANRAIVPVGSYEQVMPLDVIPTYLLRSLAVNDVEEAEKLGCLELDEEDLSLCTFVCPSKIDHGANLRNTLNIIEKEG